MCNLVFYNIVSVNSSQVSLLKELNAVLSAVYCTRGVILVTPCHMFVFWMVALCLAVCHVMEASAYRMISYCNFKSLFFFYTKLSETSRGCWMKVGAKKKMAPLAEKWKSEIKAYLNFFFFFFGSRCHVWAHKATKSTSDSALLQEIGSLNIYTCMNWQNWQTHIASKLVACQRPQVGH